MLFPNTKGQLYQSFWASDLGPASVNLILAKWIDWQRRVFNESQNHLIFSSNFHRTENYMEPDCVNFSAEKENLWMAVLHLFYPRQCSHTFKIYLKGPYPTFFLYFFLSMAHNVYVALCTKKDNYFHENFPTSLRIDQAVFLRAQTHCL